MAAAGDGVFKQRVVNPAGRGPCSGAPPGFSCPAERTLPKADLWPAHRATDWQELTLCLPSPRRCAGHGDPDRPGRLRPSDRGYDLCE